MLFNRSSGCNPSPISEWVHKTHFFLSPPSCDYSSNLFSLATSTNNIFKLYHHIFLVIAQFLHYPHSTNKTTHNLIQNIDYLPCYSSLNSAWSFCFSWTPPTIPSNTPHFLSLQVSVSFYEPCFSLESVHPLAFILNLFLLNLDHTALPKWSYLKCAFLFNRMPFYFMYTLRPFSSATSFWALHLQSFPNSPISYFFIK